MQTTLLKSSAHNTPIPDKSVHCIVMSPPYWGLRVYDGDQAVEWAEVRYKPLRNCPEIIIPGWRGGLGNEPTPEAYIGHMVLCLREWWRVLRDDGTLWVNLGDSYAGSGKGGQSAEKLSENWKPEYMGRVDIPQGLKPKDLVGIPHLFAFAAQAEGWYLRNDIIWAKPNPLPESVTDRLTRGHECIFLLAKSRKYFFDHIAIKEPLKESSVGWAERKERLIAENGVGTLGKQIESGVDGSHGYAGLALGRNGQTGYDVELGANKRDVWMVEEESDPFVRFCAERGVDLAALRDEYEGAATGKGDTWRVATKPYAGAHFAAFPEELVRPMILAGTSARGVCPACGAPWVRVVERGGVVYQDSGNRKRADAPGAEFSASSALRTGTITGKKTTGWRPTCTCNAGEPIPATVMDPFNGSGTSGRVATKLGRSYIGIDVCEEYLESLSPGRIYDTQIEMSF